MSSPLRAPHSLAFTYRRHVGGATERFLRGLARQQLLGSRGHDGRVLVPPVDQDPVTGAEPEDFVEVGPAGTVQSWTWVSELEPGHRLRGPFAFALIRPDGADAAFLHTVEVSDRTRMHTGMRVRPDWSDEPTGAITDIRTFVPETTPTPPVEPGTADATEPLVVESTVQLDYVYEPGLVLSGFLRALADRRIEGGRCECCQQVYVPAHVGCPACGASPMQPVAVADRGTVVSYTVVHVPFVGMTMQTPFAWARILLDGADVPFPHLLGETDLGRLHVGQRVRAVWQSDGQRAPTWESIRYFAPERVERA